MDSRGPTDEEYLDSIAQPIPASFHFRPADLFHPRDQGPFSGKWFETPRDLGIPKRRALASGGPDSHHGQPMTLHPLKPMASRDIPEKTLPFWRLTGPSAILVGLSVGAGEIVVWPRTVAQFGAGMVWAAVLGVLVQLAVNIEIARWTLATGESVYTGFSRVS